jgi:adhesin HecA-like repeat protein
MPFGRGIVLVGMVVGVSSLTGAGDSGSVTTPDVAYDVWFQRPGQSFDAVEIGAAPDSVMIRGGGFETPQNQGNEYAMRLRSLFTPEVSGSYQFFLSSDDDARLFFNPAGSQPEGAAQIAFVAGWTTPYQWDRFDGQQSAAFDLQAGVSYYLEAIAKEDLGDDHLAVGMRIDGAGPIEVIPSELIEATDFGSGGWRSATPSGLPGLPVSTVDPQWALDSQVHSIAVSWAPVDEATSYQVHMEGSGESQVVETTGPTVTFDGLVPLSRYFVEVTPMDATGALPMFSKVFWTADHEVYPVPAQPTGDEIAEHGVSYEYWDTGWWTLTSIPEGQLPVETDTLSLGMQAPVNLGDNHGVRLRSILTPEVTGDYTFFIAADDDARLLFNSTGSEASGAQIVASVAGWTEQYEWDRFDSQRTATFSLVAGQDYYLEAIAVQAFGVDHLEVAWALPGTDPEVIPNSVLAPTIDGAGGWRTGPAQADLAQGGPTSTGVTTTTIDQVTTTTVEDDDHEDDDHGYGATTTTQPGREIPQSVDMGDYGLVSVGTGDCGGIEMSGSKISSTGSIRSNQQLDFHGAKLDLDGTVVYGTTVTIKNIEDYVVSQDTTPFAPVLTFALSDFIPGGSLAGGATYHLHPNGLQGVSTLDPGVHYVVGDAQISGNKLEFEGVTIVATGSINLSGSSIALSPAAPGLPTLMSGSNACSSAAINLSSAKINWDGTIVALDGLVRTSGSKLDGGDIIAAAIRSSGSELNFD